MATSSRDEKEKSYVGDKKTANKFLAAARDGDVGQMEEMLAADPGLVRARNSVGWTAVHQAALWGQSAVVTDSDGWTAVHWAAYRGHTAVVRLLLDAAPELLHAETKRGSQPAHEAAEGGHADVLAVLIELGARVDAQTEAGLTPLHLAAECGREACVRVLLAADPGLVRATNRIGGTAVHTAAYRGHSAMVRLLLAAAPDLLHAETKQGRQPAHIAARGGHTDVLAVLIERGARVDAQNEDGETPLHAAAERGHSAMVRLLLAAAPDLLHAEAKDGWQPAHLAAWGGEADVLAVLMERGARVDAQTKTGDTPLHGAAWWNSEECVRVLLAAGTRVDVRNNSGQTARDVAEKWGYSHIVALLEAHEKSQQAVPSAGVSQTAGNPATEENSAATSVTTAAVAQNPTHNPAAQDQHMDSETSMISTDTAPSYVDLSSELNSIVSITPLNVEMGTAGNPATEENSAATSVPTAVVAQNPAHNPAAGNQCVHSELNIVSIDTAPSNVDIVDTAPFNGEMNSSECILHLQEQATPKGKSTRGLQTKAAKKRPAESAGRQSPNRAGPPQVRLRLLCELCESLTDDLVSHLVREHGEDQGNAELFDRSKQEQARNMYRDTGMVDRAWLEREMRGAVLSYNNLVRISRQLGHRVTGHHQEPTAAAGAAGQWPATVQSLTPPTDHLGSVQQHQHALEVRAQSPSSDSLQRKRRKTIEAGSNNSAQVDNSGRTAASGLVNEMDCDHDRPDNFEVIIPYAELKDSIKNPVTTKNRTMYLKNLSKVFFKYFNMVCACSVKMKNNFYTPTKPTVLKAKIVHKENKKSNCKNTRYCATVDKFDENSLVVFKCERV